ncbi:MAG: FKBP-type peptidyl-prolyl cis-trans isomerase [Desulfovibrio sp.]|jgi:FKBP-type peptidyl-prolyl cis-trans isomerase|nr:FKBP-type peptidyl-prolyl cis-trans isomerase [Desulfovibrio sp.]
MKKPLLTLTLAAFALVLYVASAACAEELTDDEKKAGQEIAQYEKKARTTRSGLKYVVLRPGKGKKPDKGQTVDTHYVGRLMNGKLFDRSVGRGPFSFTVGAGQVIKAWDEALMDMNLGEKRALIVPPALGYGKHGAGNLIPPNATLFFEVERLR